MKMGKQRKHYQQNRFRKGHNFYPPYSRQLQNPQDQESCGQWGKRLTTEMFDKVTKLSPEGIITAPDAEGKSGNVRFLRPMSVKRVEKCDQYANHLEEEGEMRIVDQECMFTMWNTCMQEHRQAMGDKCPAPTFRRHQEMKKGLGWKLSVMCISCQWKSAMFKLYKEIPSSSRGPKVAAPNMAFQAGLNDTTTGNTKARLLLAATNIPPPSRSGMQRLSNKASEIIHKLNEDDMAEKREQIKEINKLRGLPPEAPINVAMDVRYNSSSFGSRHKMGQNASQAVGVCTEGQTDQSQVIAVHVENKLCWVGSQLRHRGCNVTCPGGHEGCTATISASQTLSEYEIGKKIGHKLAEQSVSVKHVTTDGDARGAEGLQHAMRVKDKKCSIMRLANTTHLEQGQFRNCLKAKFSDQMFTGPKKEEKKEQQKLFALDIKHRCHQIFSIMHRDMAGDIRKIVGKMPYVIDATVQCYAGSCKSCRQHSLVCNGGKRKNWWQNSIYLNQIGLAKGSLSMTDEDEALLRKVIEMRLGRAALQLTKLNTNTNKNESVNRAICASLPKNVNFSRNARGRVSSAVHRINLGTGNSILGKLEAVGSPVSKGGRVARTMRQFQTSSNYYQEYRKRRAVRQRKVHIRGKQIKEHLQAKRERQDQLRDQYKKGQLDPKLADNPDDNPQGPDHSYATF